ncbi:MAG: 50S ribosomal protein L18 [Patescibacteria group bacterium]|nr:50S ribosomal protein L18 [Patescibacteria group bacterium]MDE1966381.1 50S ribosomal protein L18 [Patescibacteria group bacterium]
MKIQAKSKNDLRKRRHARIRARVTGTAARPRLSLFTSNRFVYAQLIDDEAGTTLAAVDGRAHPGSMLAQAKAMGTEIAKRAKAAGVAAVVFDRGGYTYGGRVKAFADAAREGGLEF